MEPLRMTGAKRRDSKRPLFSGALVALLILTALVPHGDSIAEVDPGSDQVLSTLERQAGPDREGPTIFNVRAEPSLARPGETVSLGAVITDPSGVALAWVRIDGPSVGINVTLVAFGDSWFLNRSWDMSGGYAFEIGAQDGAGNVNTAPGSFQVQDSLASTFGLVVLLGTLLGVGGGALVILWFRRRPARRA